MPGRSRSRCWSFACTSTMLMFAPERIDHHGWQLAMLSLTVAGLSDPKGARGGAIVGAASAVSLSIGLEMMPYAAMAGAIIALQWIWDRAEARAGRGLCARARRRDGARLCGVRVVRQQRRCAATR